MNEHVFYGILIPFLGTSLGAACVFFMKKTLKEQKQSEAFQKKYDNWTKKLEKKWDYNKDVDQKLWAQVSLKSADSTATETSTETTAASSEASTTEASSEATTAAKSK